VATSAEFQAAIKPGTKAEWTQLEYTVPELVRSGDSVQIDHPCGYRLVSALPHDAAVGTKIYVSVPAASRPFPPLVAVKAEAIVGSTIGGIPAYSSTALKVVEWKADAEKCQLCSSTFGLFHLRKHHHCRECGASVCSNCSPTFKCVPGYTAEQRVCSGCAAAAGLGAEASSSATPVGSATPLTA